MTIVVSSSSARRSRGLLVFGGVLSALGGIQILLGSPAVEWLPILWLGGVCEFVGGWSQRMHSPEIQPTVGTVFGWLTAIWGLVLSGFAVGLAIGFGRLMVRIAGIGVTGIAVIVFLSGPAVRKRIVG